MLKINSIIPSTPGKVYLKAKEDNVPVYLLRLGLDNMTNNAATYSIARLCKSGDKSWSKEIITFFDNSKRIIQRYFLTNGVNEKMSVYEYPDGVTRVVTSKKFIAPDKDNEIYTSSVKNVLGRWVDFKQEVQKIFKPPCASSNGKFFPKVYIKTTEYENPISGNMRKITFIDYPVKAASASGLKRVISGRMTNNNGVINLFDVKKSDNLDLSLDDEFLKFRFAGVRNDEGLEALTKYFLNKRGLAPLKVCVAPSSISLDKRDLGWFSLGDRTIRFTQELKNRPSLFSVNTSAHEVEHAFQYSMIGRLGKGRSSYETEALLKQGDLDLEGVREALKYVTARDNYPRDLSAESLRHNSEYMKKNYMERKAREAGKAAEEAFMADMKNYVFFEIFS